MDAKQQPCPSCKYYSCVCDRGANTPDDSGPQITHSVDDNCPGGHREEAAQGFKFDADKLRYDLIPSYALHELAQVYTDGAKKYGDSNYLQGMSWRRVLAALMRHVEAFRAGEDIDLESGSPHMAHAAWQCFALLVYANEGLGDDDRFVALGGNNDETEA